MENYDAQIGVDWRDRDGCCGPFGCPDFRQMVRRKEPVRVFGQGVCGGWEAAYAWKRGRRQPQAYAAGRATLCGRRDLPALLDVRSRAVGKRAILTYEGWDLRPTLLGVVTVAVAIGCRAAVFGPRDDEYRGARRRSRCASQTNLPQRG
jgi:hypothetical protein